MTATVYDIRDALFRVRQSDAISKRNGYPETLRRELAKAAFRDECKGRRVELEDQPEPPRAA